MRIKSSPISLISTAVLLSVFFCSVLTVNAQNEKTIISKKKHLISYKVNGPNVIFTIEAVKDFSNDLQGKFPDTDFFSMQIDVNRNGKIDKDLDVGYGVISKSTKICAHYLISEYATSICGELKSPATLKISFEGSKKEDKPHPIYVFTIPKTELNQGGNKVDLIFTCFSSGEGYTYYPKTRPIDSRAVSPSFAKTITIDL